MMSSIYFYELNYWLRKPQTYIYFGVFFIFALISFLGSGGFFDEPIKASESVRFLNSPHELNYMFQYLGKLFLFLMPAIIGTSIFKDFKYKVYPILYSYPINKNKYLIGKYLAAFTIVVIITMSSGFAFLFGELVLGNGNPKIGLFNSLGYLQAYVIFLIPNLFIFGIFVFAIVALSRNIYSGFIMVIFCFLLQLIIENSFQGNSLLISIIDPFGQNAVLYETQFWTLSEQNSKVIPISEIVLYNRLLWVVLALIVGYTLIKIFTLSYSGLDFQFKNSSLTNTHSIQTNQIKKDISNDIVYDFSGKQQLKLVWKLSNVDFKYLVINPMFSIFGVLGISSIAFMLLKITNTGEMVMFPSTRLMLSIPAFSFITIIILVTFIYSGMLVHRSASSGMDGLVDTTPVSNTVLLFSKVLALIKVQYLLLLILMLTGISLQIGNGFFTFELGQYLFHLFVLTAFLLSVWACTAVFVHTIVPNLYLGIFLLTLIWLVKESFSELGVTSYLLKFNSPPQLIYSDIINYGNQLPGYFLVQGYWALVAIILILLANLFWRREHTFSIIERIRMAYSRLNGSLKVLFIIFIIFFFIIGFRIYGVEHSPKVINIGQASLSDFETRFSRYANLLHPRVASIQMTMDIFPETNTFVVNGDYLLINKSNQSIDTILIKTGFDEQTSYTISSDNVIIASDSLMKYYVHKLQTPLLPKDSLHLSFRIENSPNTLLQRNSNVLKNGTFLKSDIMPRLGYFMQDEKAKPNDSMAQNNHYQSLDSDLIDFDVTISTSENQTAIATGILQKQWLVNERNYFHYKTIRPIKIGMAFNSGDFKINKDKWNDIPIEVYHHATHTYNVENMISGLKSALDYNSSHFSPYQQKEIRIIEFPLTEGSYATAFGNEILISEVRFGVNGKSKDKIDLSFYVSAHELTHHWFGNQLLPKDVLGAVMLTESITEYITLKIYEHQFGEERALQFLKLQRLRYLKGRTRESHSEFPLYLVRQEQDYISYGKGAMAFHSLAHYIGDDKMNSILKSFLEDFPSTLGFYPTSLDFLNKLKKETPDSLKYLITDMFESISFYDSKINSAFLKKNHLSYEVKLGFSVNKILNETPNKSVVLNDLIEIGFYDGDDNLIEIKQLRIKEVKNNVTFSFKVKPSKIVIDPNILTIEKQIEDNTFKF